MTEQTKKVVLPAYLIRRCEAFRIVQGNESSYLLRDKQLGRTHDFDERQWFILGALPGVETLEKLQSVYQDRFDQVLTTSAVQELFDSLAQRKLLDESALRHPLLKPYADELFDIVDGKPVPKPSGDEPAPAPSPSGEASPGAPRVEAEQKVILPPHLVRRIKAFRAETPGGTLYYLSDDVHDRSFGLEPWQFFVLEALPECDTLEKLQARFQERYGQLITQQELDLLFASIADRKLFDATAVKHPLLKPFALRTYDIVDGKAVLKSQVEKLGLGAKPAPVAPAPLEPVKSLPAGVQDAAGLDLQTASRMWPLFDPRPILRVLVPIISPLRYLAYALPVVLILALMLVFKYGDLLVKDLHDLHTRRGLLEHVIFVLLTLNLGATILMGSIAYSYKAAVERFCITLYVGFIPRFVNRIVGAERLSREQTMTLHGGNLMFRLFVFSVGVIAWYNTRDLQGSMHDFVLALVLTAGASLVLETGNPLMKGSAYFLLAAYLNEPHLRGKAYKALKNKLRVGVYQESDGTVLSIYALLFITYAFALTTFITIGLGQWLMGHMALGGSAIILVVGLLAFLTYRNYVNLKKFGDAYQRAVQFEMWRKRTLLEKGVEEGEIKTVEKPSYWRRAVAVCLFAALFIPYPYEVTGSFSLYPTRKQVLSTDTPGIVQEVFFDGGESVRQGTVIARLSAQDYQAELKVTEANILEQKAVIADLRARPKPEEVRLAEQALEVAMARERFSREKAPRLEKLYRVGAVTLEEYEAARKDHETDRMQVSERQAALALAKTGSTKEQIAAAEARLQALIEERAGQETKVARTEIRMPFDGNILTLHLKDRINGYLDKGQPLVSVEYTGAVTAELEVAESDVQYLAVDAAVRIRPASYFDREFRGKVQTIDRNVTAKSFGNVVKVLVLVENPDGVLRTGMTGEGKVVGPTMPAWKAFSQALLRFLRVQAWSWIP